MDRRIGGVAAPGRCTAALDPKIVATLKERCALAGIALHVADDDRGGPLFTVSRWAMTKQLHSVAEVERWLQRAGGPKA